jgi:hypothetical protein
MTCRREEEKENERVKESEVVMDKGKEQEFFLYIYQNNRKHVDLGQDMFYIV